MAIGDARNAHCEDGRQETGRSHRTAGREVLGAVRLKLLPIALPSAALEFLPHPACLCFQDCWISGYQAEAQLSDRQIGILASDSTYIQNMGRRTGSSSGLRCPTDASLGSIT